MRGVGVGGGAWPVHGAGRSLLPGARRPAAVEGHGCAASPSPRQQVGTLDLQIGVLDTALVIGHSALMGDGEPSSAPASPLHLHGTSRSADPHSTAHGAARQLRLFVAALAFIVASVVTATIVLWVRQTPDALLRVRSFPAGVAQVAFWALPTFVVYVAVARSRVWVLTSGVAVIVTLCVGWWSCATDRHSTASVCVCRSC